MSSPRRAAWRRIRARLTAPIIAFLQWLLRWVSWRTAQRLGACLGRFAHLVARRERRRALDHLAIAFPAMPASERARLARACFAHLGTSLFECLKLLSMQLDDVTPWLRVEGWEEMHRLRAGGRAILVLTGHCGNWELMGPASASHGLHLAGLARQQDDPTLDRVMIRVRERFGHSTIARGTTGSARELLRVLRGNGALMMLIDQDTKVEGTWVPFFGRPAFTPLGAAQLALRHDLAVVPAFVERQADGTHVVSFQPALDLPPDPVAATALMTTTIEEQIRRCPEQWVWMHRRWRRQPPPTATVNAGD